MDDLDRAIKNTTISEGRARRLITREKVEKHMHIIPVPRRSKDWSTWEYMNRYGIDNSFYARKSADVLGGWFILSVEKSESVFLCVNKGIVSYDILKADLFSALI